MNCTYSEAAALSQAIVNGFKNEGDTLVILAVPFIYIDSLVKLTEGNAQIKIAAQNCSFENSGAYTGEISAKMLASIGTQAVIVGHSERRIHFNEDYEMLRKKVDRVLENQMKPIFCCGEKLNEREDLRHFKVVEEQLWQSLFHLDESEITKCVVAYEPVWAIGTGLTATDEQAQEMHRYIRGLIAEKFSDETAASIPILYGGSCNEKNARGLFALPDVDGGLIGGASLKAETFIAIINSF